MIDDSYDYFSFNNRTQFIFKSIGVQGIVVKIIVFNRIDSNNRWNLGFGDLKGDKIDDTAFTDNHDVRKVISTIAQIIYAFSEAHPSRKIVISPVDERRNQFYNAVFQRHYADIILTFQIVGVTQNGQETYSPEKIYESFELIRKFEA